MAAEVPLLNPAQNRRIPFPIRRDLKSPGVTGGVGQDSPDIARP